MDWSLLVVKVRNIYCLIGSKLWFVLLSDNKYRFGSRYYLTFTYVGVFDQSAYICTRLHAELEFKLRVFHLSMAHGLDCYKPK